jgi:hypothetical protein
MRTFTFHLEGDRNDVPAIEWVTVRDEAGALELAATRLREWHALQAIEVRDTGQVVSRLDAQNHRRGCKTAKSTHRGVSQRAAVEGSRR